MTTQAPGHTRLRVTRAGIDTYQQPVVYMHRDCEVCRSEGFAAMTRVRLDVGARTLVATLNVVVDDRLGLDEVALSEAAWTLLDPMRDALARVRHAEPASSAGALRAKVFGARLDDAQYLALVQDVMESRLSDLELAAFVTASAGDRLDNVETTALTRAMIAVGQRLDWGDGPVLDKHCVGGLPGNRTTPIVVAIVAALGYRIPKTSSRAITSPAGTADTMEMMAPVALDLAAMRRVVEREGGCIVWGGNVRLSPADDILIRVQRPLDFDSDGQLVASVLSKKIAAGSTHVLIDMPVGPTAKVRSEAAADSLGSRLAHTASALGLQLAIHRSDGTQPVGRGIGPALEAHDVLKVLRNATDAPADGPGAGSVPVQPARLRLARWRDRMVRQPARRLDLHEHAGDRARVPGHSPRGGPLAALPGAQRSGRSRARPGAAQHGLVHHVTVGGALPARRAGRRGRSATGPAGDVCARPA